MPPNVLLVVMDCVRARNTSLHGHDRETTPFLREFADTVTWYTQARAPGTESLSSHASMFTGVPVDEHGVTHREDALAPGNTVWEELAGGYGYDTAVFSTNPYLTRLDVGLKSAFEDVYDRPALPKPLAVDPHEYTADRRDVVGFLREARRTGSVLDSLHNGLLAQLYATRLADPGLERCAAEHHVDSLLAWVDTQDGPWAACLNVLDAHSPYTPPAEHNHWADEDAIARMQTVDSVIRDFVAGEYPWSLLETFEDLYDGAIHYIDAQLRRLVTALDERGVLDDTLVLVTADHGEGFGERSRIRPDTRVVDHGGPQIHESLLHVPLLVKHPGQREGECVDAPVSLTAFATAVREFVGGSADRAKFDQDGLILSTGAEDRSEHTGEDSALNRPSFHGRAHAVYESTNEGVRKKMTWQSHASAVDVTDAQTATIADLDEETVRSDVAAVLDIVSDGVLSTESGSNDLDETTYDRLSELGYI